MVYQFNIILQKYVKVSIETFQNSRLTAILVTIKCNYYYFSSLRKLYPFKKNLGKMHGYRRYVATYANVNKPSVIKASGSFLYSTGTSLSEKVYRYGP